VGDGRTGIEAEALSAPRAGRAERRPAADAALVRAAQRGDEAAFAELFRRHWPLVHRAAWLIARDAAAAEDIAQEAFLSAVRSLDSFDRRRPLGPWLHKIAVNRAIDFARARALRPGPLDLAGADPRYGRAAGDPPPGSGVPAGTPQVGEAVLGALGALAPEQRAVVVLRHLLGYTPGEIADALRIPRGTVNSRLRRGLDALGPLLREEAGR
jgi:RNA polymerase sigma-70 factor (ECF subfamily)